jgi:hypothetical protein
VSERDIDLNEVEYYFEGMYNEYVQICEELENKNYDEADVIHALHTIMRAMWISHLEMLEEYSNKNVAELHIETLKEYVEIKGDGVFVQFGEEYFNDK